MGKIVWSRCARDDANRKNSVMDNEERNLIHAVVGSEKHDDDIKWLQLLLKNDLRPIHRAKIEDSLEWLQGGPSRTLGPYKCTSGWRNLFKTIDQRIQRGDYWDEIPEDKQIELKSKSARRAVCRMARRQELKGTKPEWMTNPAALPKKPPT